jgi:hypothetical protein
MMKKVLYYILPLTLVACKAELRDLCYDHSHISNLQVGFDWQEVPEMHPKGMTVLFYDTKQDYQEPERYDFAGTEGGTARLLTGSYRALAYNYDTETILYRGSESLSTLEAYTRNSSVEEGTQLAPFTRGVAMPRAAGTENEPVILEPDELCGAVSDGFALNIDETAQVLIKPEFRTKEVVITITNVPNLQYTSQFGGALSGLAPSVNMATGHLGEGSATESFACYAVDATTLQMKFRIFGHCPEGHDHEHEQEQGHSESLHSHLLTIYAILNDGSKWYYTADVSKQMHKEQPTPGPEGEDEIDVDIDGLPIPKPIVNGSGFQPTVDGWQSIEIDVGM